MEQPQTPDRPNLVNPTANGPTAADTNGAARASAASEEQPPPAVPLTPVAWLSQNGVYLVAFAVAVSAIYYYLGVEGLIKAAMVVVGLGFVIFIHELGHFLTAKWCDVHVQTFSLGFGPAIPGCSFRRGETLYKIAILPLGGYVAMVGEGTDADEDESYPRSFKNKTVGQRMLIISAGVVMNMILGFLCFIGVFYIHGDERLKGIVGSVEPATPAWTNEVRSGDKIKRIGGKENPNFRDLQLRVSSSWFHSKLPFEFEHRPGHGAPTSVDLEPRRDDNDDQPAIGVGSPSKLKLFGHEAQKDFDRPVINGSPAANARVIDLAPGQLDRQHLEILCRLMVEHPSEPISMELAAKVGDGAKPVPTIALPVDGFHFGDKIVGTTDAAQSGAYDPLVVKPLPPAPFDDAKVDCDLFEFRYRMKVLAGKPIVIQVVREGQSGASPVSLLVPPTYVAKTGMIMEMGAVAGIRNNSPGAKAGLREGDTLVRMELLGAGADNAVFADFPVKDPARLPFEMEQAARKATDAGLKAAVRMTVLRAKQGNEDGAGDDAHRGSNRVVLEPVEWDSSWDDNYEIPTKVSSPLSIPQLGVAYWVNCVVKEVEPGSPAAAAGIKPNDRIAEIRIRRIGKKEEEEKKKEKKDWTWTTWLKLESKRANGRVVPDGWAYCSHILSAPLDYPTIQVKVFRDGALVQEDGKDKGFEIETTPDMTWPSDNPGLLFMPDVTNVKATSILDAVSLGLNETWDMVQHIYLGMRNLVTLRSNPIKSFGGPITIAMAAFSMADDPFKFILFLGMISINLAIVNFLPIPLLDGGHMVFLIYEKIRRKPPSDSWRFWLSIAGAATIVLLMLTGFAVDIYNRFL